MPILDDQILALIQEHVRRLLVTMTIGEAQVKCTVQNDTLLINIEAGDAGRLLIGPQGTHLMALQHVIRCLLRPQLKEHVRINVDVNNYRLRREEALVQMALSTAKKAQQTGRTVTLEPMNAADRRAVHAALADQTDIKTESLGEEPNRRVVIRIASLI
jgi:spoIIIJ-associated protein